MPLSAGGLAGFLLLGILINLAIVVGAYIWHHKQKKEGKARIRVNLSEKMHGAFRWILFPVITLCWIASVYATASCQFLTVTTAFKGMQVPWGVGFVEFYQPSVISNPAECQGFASDPTGYFQGSHPAFTFAIANCILTTLCLFGIIAIQFFLRAVNLRNLLWLVMRVSMYCSAWCCIATFYIQELQVCYDYDCSLGSAGVAQVFNFLALLVCSGLLFVTECGDETAFDKCRTKTTVIRVPAGTVLSQTMG